jgi:hypothetical protein
VSRERKHLERSPLVTADSATLKGNAVLTGVVRTTKGYAVARVELGPDGSLIQAWLGPSQANKVFVAQEHHRMLAPLAVKL